MTHVKLHVGLCSSIGMALLSTGAARLSTIVYSRAVPYPCYCYYFLLMTQLFVQAKTGRESRFFVMRSALLPKILLDSRQRLLLAKQRQRVIQLGAKGCPGGGDADEAKEHARLMASGLEELVESVLDSA